MPKRMRLPKQPEMELKQKELQSTLLPTPVGLVSSLLETQESIISTTPNSIIQIQELPQPTNISFIESLRELHKKAFDSVISNLFYYQVEGEPPVHTLQKVDAILLATDSVSATSLTEKAIESGYMYCLGMWASGKAKGPRNKKFLLKEIKKEEAFAGRMKAKGFKLAAKKHKELAKALHLELAKIL